MKNLSIFALFFALLMCMSLTAFASDAVVYADGTNYATLAAAANALPEGGGTIVVTGAVAHSVDTAVTMPQKPIVVI